MQKEKKERRSFFRMMAKLGLAGGIGGLLLSRIGDKTFVPPAHAADMVIDATNTGTGTTTLKSSTTSNVFAAAATTTTGSGTGLYGSTASPNGIGVAGYGGATTGTSIGVFGTSAGNGVGVYGWATGSAGAGVVGAGGSSGASGYFASNVGIGIFPPARALHLQGRNAAFRMDRDVDSAAFILTRTAAGDFTTIWKTFYVGVNASGVNNGEFFIGDAGNKVSGSSIERLRIDNSGTVHIPDLSTGDIKLANDFILTEEGEVGVAFKNPKGEKVAVLDDEGNFYYKGELRQLKHT